jgi:hypothetical protein
MLGVILELHAQAAARHWVVRITGYVYEFAVFHVIQERARIGAILWASTSDDTGFADVNRHRSPPSNG